MQKTKNRAWFLCRDGRAPLTLYVRYNQEKNKQSSIDFMQGKEHNLSDIKPIIYNVENNKWANPDYIRSWDFLPNSSSGIILANERALKLLEEIASGEFQAIPTEIRIPDGYIITEYKLINVIKKVPGLLLEHSIINPNRKIDDIFLNHYKLIYHKLDALGELNLAREQKLYIGALYGSNKLKEAIKAAKLTGLTFRDYYAGYQFWHGE